MLNTLIKEQLICIKEIDSITHFEEYTIRFIDIVLNKFKMSVLLAKSSLYDKKLKSKNLSPLQKKYNLFCNQAKKQGCYYGYKFLHPQYNVAKVVK